MSYNTSIAGVAVARDISKDEYEQLKRAERELEDVRGVGLKTAARILQQYPSSGEILDAGNESLAEMDGIGESTATRIIASLEQSAEGWEETVNLKVEYNPEDEQPYRVQVSNQQPRSGYSLKGALNTAANTVAEQRLLDQLR